jgi:DNA-binding transcriptional LysR family regulator
VPRTSIVWPSTLSVVTLIALEGGGIGILPTHLVGEDLHRGRLVRVLPALEPETLGVHAIFLSRQHQPLALRLLVDHLVERFGGGTPPWDP